MRPIILALPKGRIMEEAATLFGKAGYDLSPVFAETRKLVLDCGPVRVLVLRNSDIGTYVSHGAADIGVAGSDVLADERTQAHLRIATKYPKTTRAYLVRRGITAEVIKLSGAIELGPLTGLCDRIVDITQTGETLRQNGLVEIDTVAEVSSRLVVNPARLKLDGDRLGALIDALERAVA